MENCVFCKIVNGTLPTMKVYEDDYTLAFMDLAKDVDGHILVIPKKHISSADDINSEKGTDYTQSDVYFEFEPQIPTNELEKAQIELMQAQRRQAEINTLLMLTTKLDNETVMQLICEQLDIDYNEIKDKLPPPEEMNDPYQAQNLLDTLPTEPDDGGDVIAE